MCTILFDAKYRSCTWFLIVTVVLSQLSGVNAINIYSSDMLKKIEGLDPILANYMLMSAACFGTIAGPMLEKYFTIKTLMMGGEFFLGV